MKLPIAAWTHIMAERSHGLMQKPETKTKKGMSQEEPDFSSCQTGGRALMGNVPVSQDNTTGIEEGSAQHLTWTVPARSICKC